MTQEVILLEDVDGLGIRGATVRVAPGYARNYLLPYRKAIARSGVGERMLVQLERAKVARDARERGNAEALAKLLGGVSLVFERQVGDEEKLYGSVSVQDIHEALEAKNLTLARKQILLAEPIKTLGDFDVTIRCYADISASIKVQVKDANPEPAPVVEAAPAEATPAEAPQDNTDTE